MKIYRKLNKKLFVWVLMLALFGTSAFSLSAQFQIVSLSPLYFNLSFSEPTLYPEFQILVNQPAIGHKPVSNTSQISSSYIIQGIYPDDIDQQSLIYQKYKLIFSFPLKVGNGDLQINSFILRADPLTFSTSNMLLSMEQKNSYFEYQNDKEQLKPLAITIAAVSYFLALTTIIGLNTFFFITIYAYIALKSPLYTAFDYKIAYYFLSEPHLQDGNPQFQLFYVWIPIISILISLILGLISRKLLYKKAQTSWFWNQIYTFFTYKLFLLIWNMFLVSILIDAIHLIQDPYHFSKYTPFVGYLYIYLAFVISATFIALIITIMNPHIKQPYSKFENYLKSSHFIVYQSLHNGVDLSNWKKRNYILVMVISRIFILFSLAISSSLIPNLFVQVFILVYLFAVRPFKKDFFNYAEIGIQVVVVLFYLYLYIVNLYVLISSEITTTTDIRHILISNIVFVSIIIFGYFILGLFQLYDKIRHILFVSNQWERIKETFYKKETVYKAEKDQEQNMTELRPFRRRSSISKRHRDPQSEFYPQKQSFIDKYNERSEQTDNKLSPKQKKKSAMAVMIKQSEFEDDRSAHISQKPPKRTKSKSKTKSRVKRQKKKESLLDNMVNNASSDKDQ